MSLDLCQCISSYASSAEESSMPWDGDGSFDIRPFLSPSSRKFRALYKLYKNTVVWLKSSCSNPSCIIVSWSWFLDRGSKNVNNTKCPDVWLLLCSSKESQTMKRTIEILLFVESLKTCVALQKLSFKTSLAPTWLIDEQATLANSRI